jgi:hypothetical protein
MNPGEPDSCFQVCGGTIFEYLQGVGVHEHQHDALKKILEVQSMQRHTLLLLAWQRAPKRLLF